MPDTPDEELVRRLLADARHDEPMPADVSARLDGVLAHLADEDRQRDVVTPLRPTPSPAPRRRRWATALVAAAAVVVGGVTLRAVWPDGTGMSDSGGAASESSGRSAASDSGSDSGSKEAPTSGLLGAAEVAELHRATLRADVRRAVERLRTPLDELTPPPTVATVPFACAEADWGPGSAHPARLDGEDAMLVLRPVDGGRQVVDVVECGTARPLATVTLPAR